MIAIIYMNNKPLYCFRIINYISGQTIVAINEKWGRLKILQQIEKNGELHLNSEFEYTQGEYKYNISNHYEKTPGNIKPIWVENDHGKQITFLIE